VLALCAGIFASAGPVVAQSSVRVGTLACDVSAGIGLFVVQKQTLRCTFRPDDGGLIDSYTGKIDEFGVALGEVAAAHLVWGVIAPFARSGSVDWLDPLIGARRRGQTSRGSDMTMPARPRMLWN
jgi:hypothetical protein